MIVELGDLDGLVGGDVAEDLGRPAGRPVDLQHRDPFGLGQADVCSSGLAPQLLPEETCRWIVSGCSPAVTTLIRAPMAARLVFLPTSLTVSQWFPWPGFWNRML